MTKLLNRHSALKKLRTAIRRTYYPLIALLSLWVLYTVIILLTKGHNWFIVAITAIIATGFLITFLPKYVYHGSLIVSIFTAFFISMYISVRTPLITDFLHVLLIASTLSMVLVLSSHYLTRTRTVLPRYTVFFSVFAYIITTLLAFYMEGTEPGTDRWLIFTSFLSVVFLQLITLNVSFRQHRVGALIDISDLEVYFKIAEELKTEVKSHSNLEPEKIDDEVEKIVSDLQSSVNSFVHEHYEESIIHSYNVKEGLSRIFYDWMKVNKDHTFLEKEKEALTEWRRNIAHSNVRKPFTSASERRKKEKKKRKRLENPYIKNLRADYEKALISVDFIMRMTRHISEYSSVAHQV